MKEVRALVLKQKQTKLYVFTMNAVELEGLCYVEAASRDHLKGLQRVTEAARLRDIADFLATGEDSLLPNNIILNLKSEVTVTTDADGKMATIKFPSATGEFAFIVDGQHRLFSFQDEHRKLPDAAEFELAVVAFHSASEEVVGATFVAINVNQKPVNRDLLTQMKAILGLLEDDIDKTSVELVHVLDEDPDSPLHQKILRFPKEKGKWIKTNQLLDPLRAMLAPSGCLHDKSQAERKRILIAYLKALRQTFPEAWAEDTRHDYALLQPVGIQLSLALLPDIMLRCDFNEAFSYNVDTFTRQMAMLTDMALLGRWNRSVVEPHIANNPKRKAFLQQLKENLRVRPATARP